MALTNDIVRTWRGPRAVMRDFLAQGPREDRALVFLYLACGLIFVAQWPLYARQVAGFDVPPGTEELTMSSRLTYGAFGWFILAPLAFYAVAAVSHLIARLLGGQGSPFGARLALFWSLLASCPLLLLYGLTRGFVGVGAQTTLVGALWVLAFFWIWFSCLREAEAGG